MTEAYEQSAARHWRDGTLLESEHRHASANQLFGLAAECALEAALGQLSEFVKEGRLDRYYRTHIDVLWGRIRVQSIQKRFPALAALLKIENPFHDWSIEHRYCREGTVTEEASLRHCAMARRLLGTVGIHGTRGGR